MFLLSVPGSNSGSSISYLEREKENEALRTLGGYFARAVQLSIKNEEMLVSTFSTQNPVSRSMVIQGRLVRLSVSAKKRKGTGTSTSLFHSPLRIGPPCLRVELI